MGAFFDYLAKGSHPRALSVALPCESVALRQARVPNGSHRKRLTSLFLHVVPFTNSSHWLLLQSAVGHKKASKALARHLEATRLLLQWASQPCRGDRIRTCDSLLPKQVRYRTALHPVFGREDRDFYENARLVVEIFFMKGAERSGNLLDSDGTCLEGEGVSRSGWRVQVGCGISGSWG